MSPRIRRVSALLVLAVLSSVVVPVGVRAASPRAVLDGSPISLSAAGALSCHDFASPVLTCFTGARQMLADAERRATDSGSTSRVALAAAASGYVVVFEHGAYAGAAQALSQDYSYLGTIGWNDKISSVKSYGATGRFWDNAPNGGILWSFVGTTRVSYVGDTYNDKFSALDLQ